MKLVHGEVHERYSIKYDSGAEMLSDLRRWFTAGWSLFKLEPYDRETMRQDGTYTVEYMRSTSKRELPYVAGNP